MSGIAKQIERAMRLDPNKRGDKSHPLAAVLVNANVRQTYEANLQTQRNLTGQRARQLLREAKEEGLIQ